MAHRFLHVDDFTEAELDAVLEQAARYANGVPSSRSRSLIGLAFFETSLRTRVGFAAAAHRIGSQTIQFDERRSSEISMPESFTDTIRVLSGYVDALVVRSSRPTEELAQAALPEVGWLNAGDRGPNAEHPSQALVDLFAIEQLQGGLDEQRIVLCGDLRSRAARSLLAVLARRKPEAVGLLTDACLLEGFALPEALASITRPVERNDLDDATVLYAVGIPHGAADEGVRSRLRVDRRMLGTLRTDAIVLSPMPIIDEIATSSRRDPRMRYFVQSDLALHVRSALLELMVVRVP